MIPIDALRFIRCLGQVLASTLLLTTAVYGQSSVPAAMAPASPAAGVRLNAMALAQAVGIPPAPGSAVAGQDLAVLLWLQSARTPEMEASSWLLLERTPISFSRALGVDMAKTTPLINAGLKAFLKPVDVAEDELKDRYKRPRPFVSNPQVQPCLPLEQGYSFPSGHSTWYRAASELLADLLPERRSRLLAIGSHGGNSRVLCGVHYPSDVQAGQRLGAAAAAQLIATPQWQAFKVDPAVIAEVEAIRRVPQAALPELVR